MLLFSDLFVEVGDLEPDDVAKSLKQAAIWGAGALLPSFINKQQDNIERRNQFKKLKTSSDSKIDDQERKKNLKHAAITGLSSAAAGALGYLAGK